MAAVGETDSSLAAQCLDLCQALTSQGKAFQFSLTIGTTFAFTLDSRCKDPLVSATKKKASPSTIRRNAKRKEEFLKKKSKPADQEQEEIEAGKEPTSHGATLQCGQCEKIFKSEPGLKIHIGKAHKAPPTEHVREISLAAALNVSPMKDSHRIVPCHVCGEEMSPSHTCDDDECNSLSSSPSKTFKCFICGEDLNSEDSLENHYNTKHPNQCRDCKAMNSNPCSFFCSNYKR